MLLTKRRSEKTPEHAVVTATPTRSRRWPIWPIAAGGLAALVVALVGVLTTPAAPESLPVSNGAASSAPAGPGVVVTRIVDGDTVEVTGPLAATVQVLGIDAPEYPGGACWAKESRDFASRTLDGKTVTVVSDPSQPAVDRRGRTLGYLRLADGSDFSVRAVAAGMATYHDDGQPVASAAEIMGAQTAAQNAKAGLWGPPCDGNIDAPASGASATPTAVRQAR